MAILAANMQHYFGPRLQDLAIKHKIKFNEIELLKRNQTKDQLLALLTNDIRTLDRIFEFKKHSPTEQKEIDEKEFHKEKRLNLIIKGLLHKGLLEQAIAIYLYKERLKVVMQELRRIRALKEEAIYAEQVAIAEAEKEKALLLLESQKALFAELDRLQKEQNDLFKEIKGHKEAIIHWNNVIDQTHEQMKQLNKQAAIKLVNDLQDIIPEASPEKRLAAANEFFHKHHELKHEKRVLKAQNKQLEKKISKKEEQIQDKENRIRQLKHEIVPKYAKSEKLNKDDPLSSTTFTTQFNNNQIESKQRLSEQSKLDQFDPRIQELSDLQKEITQTKQDLLKLQTKLSDNKTKIKNIDVEETQLARVHATKLVAEANIPAHQKQEKIEAVTQRFEKGLEELHKDKRHQKLTSTLDHAVDNREEETHLLSVKLEVAKENQKVQQVMVDEIKFTTTESLAIENYYSPPIDSTKPIDQKILDDHAKTIEDNDDFLSSLENECEDTPQNSQKATL